MRFIAVLLAAAACVDTPPMAEPVVESSHVEITEIPASPVPKLDVLVFVDDTTAMSAHADRVAMLPRALADQIEILGRGWSDLRLAVTSNDGTFHSLPNSESSYLVRSLDYDFRVWQNYEGSLEDVLGAMMQPGVAREGASQPIDAIRVALERNSRFLRADAGLAIVIIAASDDASPWPVTDYVTWMNEITGGNWSRRIVISAIYPQPAPRLDELTLALRGLSTPIDSTDYSRAFEPLWGALSGGWWSSPCFDKTPADRDPNTPGLQYDCAMSVYVDGQLRALPQCAGSSEAALADDTLGIEVPTSGCWSLLEDHQCSGESSLSLRFDGYTNGVHPAYRFECRTR